MIYFHIPFCKQACHYCDFHFSTSLKLKQQLLDAMAIELNRRADYLENKDISSIYFGGGTPSILSTSEIQSLIDQVQSLFNVLPNAEITLEANPDDLTHSKIKEFKQTAINRFSIGIQSFFEEDLRWMNRSHSSDQASLALDLLQQEGFSNISCDLIYGYPLLSDKKWDANIQKLIDLEIPHISSYSMTVESKTALDHFIKAGKTPPMNDEQSNKHFLHLISKLEQSDYQHYEISNFAQKGHTAIHNSNYWKGTHYLGIGPSAHSFNGDSRSWNIAQNVKYIKRIEQDEPTFQQECLEKIDRYNEYIMTALRTIWGVSEEYINKEFGTDMLKDFQKNIKQHEINERVVYVNGAYTLTSKGKLFADLIASDLFMID